MGAASSVKKRGLICEMAGRTISGVVGPTSVAAGRNSILKRVILGCVVFGL